MAEKRSIAPASGDIVAGRAPAASRERFEPALGAAGDFVDAEYETLAAPPGPPQSAATQLAPVSGLDLLRGEGSPKCRTPRTGALWLPGTLAVAAAFWIGGGHALLDRWPSSPVPPVLRIGPLDSRIEAAGGRSLLLVDGEAVNEGEATERLPDLAIKVLDGGGRTTHYFLGTNGAALAAGGRFAFSGRLAAPKDGVRSVSVTFREQGE